MDLVDQRGRAVADPINPAAVGRRIPRVRMVSALPLMGTTLVHAVEVEGALVVGTTPVYVPRFVSASRD